MLESTSVIKIPDLTCTTGSTSITYSIEKYNTKPPTWVTIDKATGQLNINAPNVSADTNYSFYINSAVSGISDPVKKLVSVTVQNWAVEFCSTCSSSPSTCSIWNSGYSLTSSSTCWIPVEKVSEAAKALTMTTQAVTGSSAVINIFLSFVNTNAISNVWSMVNQVQISKVQLAEIIKYYWFKFFNSGKSKYINFLLNVINLI